MVIQRLTEEWNEASAYELKNHLYGPCFCFGNMSDFFVPSVNAMIPELRSADLFQTKLVPLVMKDKAVKMILGRSNIYNTHHTNPRMCVHFFYMSTPTIVFIVTVDFVTLLFNKYQITNVFRLLLY